MPVNATTITNRERRDALAEPSLGPVRADPRSRPRPGRGSRPAGPAGVPARWPGRDSPAPLTRFVWKVYELIELGLDLRWGAARRGLRAAVRSASRVPNHPAAVRRLRFARSRCHLAGLAVTGRAGQPGQDGP